MEIIEKDYINWKNKRNVLLDELDNNNSTIYDRVSPFINSLDALTEKEKTSTLDDDELLIFQTGFNYLNSQINIIDSFLSKQFNNNIDELIDLSSTINFYLYLLDFESEIDEIAPGDKIEKFRNMINEVELFINNKMDLPDEKFVYINEYVNQLFSDCNLEYMGLIDIFQEIEDELNKSE